MATIGTKQDRERLKSLIWEVYIKDVFPDSKPDDSWDANQVKVLAAIINKQVTRITLRPISDFSKSLKGGNYLLSLLVELIMNEMEGFQQFIAEDELYQGENRWLAFVKYSTWMEHEKQIVIDEPTVPLSTQHIHPVLFDPILYIDKLSSYKLWMNGLLWISLYYLIILLWAYFTDVLTGIEYPLSQSYAVIIGYPLFAIIMALFTTFYHYISELLGLINQNTGDSVVEQFKSPRIKILLAVPALFIAVYLHHTFLSDDIHGWCESESGVLSGLGMYHMVLYAFNLWAIFMFIFYFFNFRRIVNKLTDMLILKAIPKQYYIQHLIPAIGKLGMVYKLIIIFFGLFAILFFIGIIQFIKREDLHTLFFWQWVEIFILVVLYMFFGFMLYWRFFHNNMLDFMVAARKILFLDKDMPQREALWVLDLPKTPDEINPNLSKMLNIILWFLAIAILILLIALVLSLR
ncbi:MAG: hypothetical protein K9I34_01980 [Bacteroidales bacterium]|nr:hypothetical protein [Bacteroidales bacterium]